MKGKPHKEICADEAERARVRKILAEMKMADFYIFDRIMGLPVAKLKGKKAARVHRDLLNGKHGVESRFCLSSGPPWPPMLTPEAMR